jgi:DNA end-binding protein Ku
MARPIWSGVITFGLVTVPVRMFAAVEDHTVHFHQLERGTGDRVRNKRVNGRTGEPVESQDIVKGYDVGDGQYVVVEPEELAEIAPGKSRSIEISAFVELAEVDPAFFGRTYYLAPRGEEYGKVYELLRAALAESERTGIATFVMHAREYLVALRAQDEVLTLHTLHWSDEVRDPHADLPQLPGHGVAQGKELKMAQQLIDSMTTTWQPEDYEDTYETRVWDLVEAKRKGEEIVIGEEPPEATNVVDLSEALRRSVDQAAPEGRQRRGGRGAGKSKGKSKDVGTGSGRGAGRGTGQGKAADEGKERKDGKRASAAGEGAGRDLSGLSKNELYERAAAQGLPGRSRMTRDQLIDGLSGSPSRSRRSDDRRQKAAS